MKITAKRFQQTARETISDPEVNVVRHEGSRVVLSFDPARIAAPELIARITSEHAVEDLFVENPPIEEIIARIYRGAAL